MKIDYRVAPGLISKKELIVSESKKMLGVKKLIGRTSAVSGCKRMITVLVKSFYKEPLVDIGAVVNVDHATVLHYQKQYGYLYEEDGSDIYYFMFLSLKAKVQAWKSFDLIDVFTEAIERMSMPEYEKIQAITLLTTDSAGQRTRNTAIRAIILYLQKKLMSNGEISAIIGQKDYTYLSRTELINKHLYLSEIDYVVKQKIEFLKNQEDEKRKINYREKNNI